MPAAIVEVEESVVLRPDPESSAAVAQERGRLHLLEIVVDGKRFERSIDGGDLKGDTP